MRELAAMYFGERKKLNTCVLSGKNTYWIKHKPDGFSVSLYSSPRRMVFLAPIVSGNQILPLPIVAHNTPISHLQLSLSRTMLSLALNPALSLQAIPPSNHNAWLSA